MDSILDPISYVRDLFIAIESMGLRGRGYREPLNGWHFWEAGYDRDRDCDSILLTQDRVLFEKDGHSWSPGVEIAINHEFFQVFGALSNDVGDVARTGSERSGPLSGCFFDDLSRIFGQVEVVSKKPLQSHVAEVGK